MHLGIQKTLHGVFFSVSALNSSQINSKRNIRRSGLRLFRIVRFEKSTINLLDYC